MSQTPTPEKKRQGPPPKQLSQAPSAPSSPLSDPPPSSRTNLTWDDQDEPGSQLDASLLQSIRDKDPPSFAPEQSFQSTGSAAPPSSLGSFVASQRIVKDGKEVVISSDGEDTDSIASLDDADLLLGPKFRQQKQETKPIRVNKAYLQKPSASKTYKNSLDSLVHAAINDQETEANVAKIRAVFEPNDSRAVSGQDAGTKKKKDIQETALTSALKDPEDENHFRRLMDAVRRTEALDQDRVWHFFDQVQMTPAASVFPRDLFAPDSHLSALRGWSMTIYSWSAARLTL